MLLAAIICHHNYFADLSGIFERSKPPPKHNTLPLRFSLVRGVYIYRFWRLKTRVYQNTKTWVFLKIGGFTPKWMVFSWKTVLKWMIWGVKNPIFGNTKTYSPIQIVAKNHVIPSFQGKKGSHPSTEETSHDLSNPTHPTRPLAPQLCHVWPPEKFPKGLASAVDPAERYGMASLEVSKLFSSLPKDHFGPNVVQFGYIDMDIDIE